MDVFKSAVTSRRVTWSFRIQFDEGFEETVELVTKQSGVLNIQASNKPLPEPPTPPPTPPPASPATADDDSAEPLLPQHSPTFTLHGKDPTWMSLSIYQILFVDEKHLRCKVGMCNSHEWIMCVDPADPGKLFEEKDGGVHQSAQPYTKPKYEKEIRGVFGVMMTREEGRRM